MVNAGITSPACRLGFRISAFQFHFDGSMSPVLLHVKPSICKMEHTIMPIDDFGEMTAESECDLDSCLQNQEFCSIKLALFTLCLFCAFACCPELRCIADVLHFL